VALITGAGSGIGRQMAHTLAADGWSIAAIDLHEAPLASLATELSGKPVAWATADVTDRAGLDKAASQVQERLGSADLLIASAGVGFETSALDYRAADVETIIRVNLIGVSNSIGTVLPGMIERQRGHIVALSSQASYRGLPRMAGYCASKAGLNALLESIRVEVEPLGIAVTAICPGWIRTPMTADIDLDPKLLMEVDEAARRIHAAIRRRQPFLAFPRSGALILSVLRWLPARTSDRLLPRLLGPIPEKKAPS
jgi:NAD(P)-dependent dehydrogenase (short-subunit alcohol dehydrogenase family)